MKNFYCYFSLLAFGYMFQACDNSKTYAEMLDEEKDAVNAFIKNTISRLFPRVTLKQTDIKRIRPRTNTWLSQTESTCKLWIRV